MLFYNLLKITSDRVKRYGAQYYTFAIFGLVNYPLAFLYEFFSHAQQSAFFLRLICFLLSIILFVHNKWSEKYKKYLPIYWYVTIIFCVPFFTTFMLLKHNLSMGWLINFNIGVLIMVLLLDSMSFIICEFIGIALGAFLYFLTNDTFSFHTNSNDVLLFLYMFVCIIIFGPIFSKNKEVFNHLIQKEKDDLNRQLEKKVEMRTKELQKALAAKTEFLNNLSHEIRTPIQGFTVLSEGLVENWYNFEDKKKFDLASTVASNARRLASLMLSLLDLSKFNANKVVLDIHEIDLVEVVQEIIKESEDLYIGSKNIKIETHFPEAAILSADYNKIGQVLRNLFSNAIKFSPNDGKLNIVIEPLGSQWRFAISDDGLGIPESELEDIFDHFVQSTRTKTGAGGTGLGLSISRKIIEAHNGVIWAENNANKKGSTFYFIIPRLNVKLEK